VTRICPGNDRRSVVRWFSGSVVQWFSSRDLQEILMTVERRWPQALAWGWRRARMIGGRHGCGLRRAGDDRERTAAPGVVPRSGSPRSSSPQEWFPQEWFPQEWFPRSGSRDLQEILMTVERRWPPRSGSPRSGSRDLQEILMTVERRWPQASAWGWLRAKMIGGRPGASFARSAMMESEHQRVLFQRASQTRIDSSP